MPDFFRTLTIPVSEAAHHPDAIRRMRNGEFEGILLRGTYDEAECARLCERLEAGDHGLIRSNFPPVCTGIFLGARPNPRRILGPEGLFRGGTGVQGGGWRICSMAASICGRGVAELLSALDSGRPYVAAPGPEPGVEHMFTTIRAHRPGGFIPPHFDNEQAFRPSYRLVRGEYRCGFVFRS